MERGYSERIGQHCRCGQAQNGDTVGRRIADPMRISDGANSQELTGVAFGEANGIKGAALNLGLHALAEAAGRLGTGASTSAGQLALALQRFDETLAATRALCAAEPALAP